ncbi:MAG: glutamate--tRNA ligase [Candidatus Levyibacteriota bacterium]
MLRQNSAQVIRVRIAPSPTGIPHIGNTRTALFNYLFAKHNNGKFILRIEDTDRARYVAKSEEAIYEIFNWLCLEFDEKYIQSERFEIYKKHADELLKNGSAYKEAGAIWFKVPKEKKVSWKDAIGEKEIKFDTNTIADFVILKSDGFPTYHLASVVDDCLMKISHIIRGDEWISSTPKHLLLYQAFGWQSPFFAHLPVILGPDKTKLSKRHGAKSVLDYRNDGYLKEALLNFMALLGWNPGGEKEIMSLEEMINIFDLKDVNLSGPIFDIKKLEWMNGVYIRKSQVSNLKSQILERLKIKDIDEPLVEKLIPLTQTRMNTLNDFCLLTKHFFEEPKIKLDQKEKEIAKKIAESFSAIEQWNNENILSVLKKIMNSENIKMPIIYKILTGEKSGLPLPQSLEILGKEKTIKRLKKLIP